MTYILFNIGKCCLDLVFVMSKDWASIFEMLIYSVLSPRLQIDENNKDNKSEKANGHHN